MKLIEVTDSKTKKQFHKVPHLIYKKRSELGMSVGNDG